MSAAPSGTTILASVPSSTASYSIVALSVSISAMTSPGLILSPSFLSHLARLPFSMVGDSAGIRILVGIGPPHGFRATPAPTACSPIGDRLRGRDDLGDRRQRELFQVRRIGHRHVLARYARDRCIEIIE